MKKITVLGSTGSIGTQTLQVMEHHADRYELDGLAAGSNAALLIEQALRFRPKRVCLATEAAARQAKEALPAHIEVLQGEAGLVELAGGGDADTVVTALVGSRGLPATLAAIEAGKSIALANKETLVTAGHLVMEAAKRKGVSILPVDSEHSAIFQCLNGERREDVRGITLTASGGSFRDRTRDQLQGVTVEQALNHPNWSMGAKITIDSATMVNKGLEVIEAKWLFGLHYDEIDVLIHPESIIHSFVEFNDNSVIAQLGLPDMRVPIQYALSYPERLHNPSGRLSLAEYGKLTFREMDFDRYRCLALAFASGRAGGTATTVFNAANEVAVDRFLRGEIEFLAIESILEKVMEKHEIIANPDLEAIAGADSWARRTAASL
ncbi:1-deoxy-D-xylulose-5-phosphate reductoisomerase [Paenibacillus pasadenensis]|uniref:1-deoxy-D-xylulose-5-phosphate reductoisomerase n=1 Tax=Paenibacillus pasadenensis TaxID=217090 RepID=UPI00203B8028|nr:1-deoxy-D-xylulose-5-phosphate reductoisomerase [Paenibacillus pasadenensis]